MISAEQNELITRVGPGTPCGALLRPTGSRWRSPTSCPTSGRSWRCACSARTSCCSATSRPARADRPLLPASRRRPLVRPARGRRPALPVPRLAVRRRRPCLETPAEPEGSRSARQDPPAHLPVSSSATASSSPTSATASRPPSPTSTASSRPTTHTFAFKGLIECNWLQALEVGIDPAHASFLHRFFEDEDPRRAYGQQFREQPRPTPTSR